MAVSRFIHTSVHLCVLSCVWLFVTPYTVVHQAPLSLEFSRQEYLCELLFPSSDLSNRDQTPISWISYIDKQILHQLCPWEAPISLQMTQFCSFLWLSNIPLCVYIYIYIYMYIFFIHSSVDGYLGCFHAPAIVNSAVMNTEVFIAFNVNNTNI